MAGSLAIVEADRHENEELVKSIKGQWKIHFARFILHPSLPSTCRSLVPLTKRQRSRSRGGNWIATSSPAASLQIINDLSSSETILTVSLSGKILEEHYISNLHFSWPQIQCIPEIPARGSRAVFVSYKDCTEEIQKFALRFSTNHEAESFMNTLQEKFKGEVEIEPLNTDFGSDFSPQSEFISSNRLPSRANQELTDVNLDGSYTPQMSPSLSYEIRHQSFDQDPILNNNSDGIFQPLPPSFTSLLTNCCAEKATNQPRVSEEIDLKSQIAKYMEDSSFQDLLTKVEKIISDVGADMLL
ncbi:LOW QUALITY PROTEIN: protein POOR HOMOLOGOUS SYNAPSIS 1-like [Hibiscus syriacus]|uniref:LOW QUALITY PROTEIN: protein POOR HOMOLOGOUS SYNAPSIS 1-like n=1 Tax=Hibiscus syriacus TaxID=106335 RepID=UPI00192221B2|nr:LOW QUALITY PROTEIN: protein POOR HOMOLOGOUS SYNAPSIS 1-like [Hibiscus syriacus]